LEAVTMAQGAIAIIDESPGVGRRIAFTLELWSERVTARELIERRVRHEVQVHNDKVADTFHGLIQPRHAEPTRQGWRLKTAQTIDAEEQVAAAWQAFDDGGILLLVDDRQVDALDEEFSLREGAEVCFYKLVPLVGG
jgi:hypothetical protein